MFPQNSQITKLELQELLEGNHLNGFDPFIEAFRMLDEEEKGFILFDELPRLLQEIFPEGLDDEDIRVISLLTKAQGSDRITPVHFRDMLNPNKEQTVELKKSSKVTIQE